MTRNPDTAAEQAMHEALRNAAHCFSDRRTVMAAMLESIFTILEPEGRFAPSHYKAFLRPVRQALALHYGITETEMIDRLAAIWHAAKDARHRKAYLPRPISLEQARERTRQWEQDAADYHRKEALEFADACLFQAPRPRCWRHLVCQTIALANWLSDA